MNRTIIAACLMMWSVPISGPANGQNRDVDFRWAPEQYLTVAGLPDDWQKTMVTESGALAYDFGPGPYARNLTSVTFGLSGHTLKHDAQRLPDGKTPIVSTYLSTQGAMLQLTSFAVIPENYTSPKPSSRLSNKLSRIDGLNGARGWARPSSELDPAFSNVAWGTNRAIRYQADVEPGQRYKVATGFLEGWKSTAGARPLEIHVEGSEILTIDPVADGTKGQAYVHVLDGVDLNNDGKLNIEIHPSATGPDPNTILSVLWVFPESFNGLPDNIAKGVHNTEALVYFDCGLDSELAAPWVRHDVVHAKLTSGQIQLELRISTNRELQWDKGSRYINSQMLPFITLSHAPISVQRSEREWIFTLPEGIGEAYAVATHGASDHSQRISSMDAEQEIIKATAFWESNVIVPQNAMLIPDEKIQFLADASLRNMYQVRDFVNGNMQFQPGPSVYRGLWVTDFVNGAALATSDTVSVRAYIEAILDMPTEDGHFRAMVPNVSFYENPTFLTAAFYYARSTGNLAWLTNQWPKLENGIDWLVRQRESTLKHPESPNYGLLPAGFVDGGISELNADYGSAMWTLTALEYGIHAARSIGQYQRADQWQTTFGDMLASLIRAIARDLQSDENGIRFLPTLVGATNPKVPQLGSYGFIWPAKFSHFMHDKTTIMGSVMDINLTYYESQKSQGLLKGTGWLSDGLWHWLSAMHGSIQLEHGWRDQGIATLYALSNHSSPTGVWVEEQLPAHLGNRTTGDVSNAQSSAAYYMFVRDLIAFETDKDIILFRGIPVHWVEPGKSTKLLHSHTLFGPLYVHLETTTDNQTLIVSIDATALEISDGKVIIDTGVIREAGFKTPSQHYEVTFGESAKFNFTRE
jgi:hypothetical protein